MCEAKYACAPRETQNLSFRNRPSLRWPRCACHLTDQILVRKGPLDKSDLYKVLS